MRKALLFAPMLMLLLTACGGGGEKMDPAAELQAQYAALASATMEADITCHYADEVREYTLLCAYTPSESTVTVLAPSNLSGISATVADGKLQLSYEDISLDAGSYSAAAISPVAALPRLMAAAGSGYITEQSEESVDERTCLRLACDLPDDESTLYTTWFDQETLLPLRSEITVDGELIFEIAWTRFEVTGTAAPEDGDSSTQPDTPEDSAPSDEETPAEPAPEDAENQQEPSTDTWTEAEEAAAYANAEE
ncbi:MAG: hypothetical protein HDT15_06390 [Oscillibacter sp.]|nr:hypothetical protein [Oscillibacter sp.]